MEQVRRLIVNADDFGRDHAANEGIIDAFDRGILTTASLMVNEPAAAEAVELAKKRPGLGVGLHLTLVCGHSALSQKEIPHLADGNHSFTYNPVKAGMCYFFNRAARAELKQEIAAQFEKFRETGLTLDHVNGHLHLHLHPAVAEIVLENAKEWGIRSFRWTRDLFWAGWKLGKGPLMYRVSHAIIFNMLSKRVEKRLNQLGIRYVPRVFGLMQTSNVNEEYLLKLLDFLPEGDSEVYSHPSVEAKYQPEYQGLISERVVSKMLQNRIQKIRCQDL